MKRGLAVITLLVAAHAAAAPPVSIDEGTLKAALEQRAVKIVSLERHLGPPDVPEGAFARACQHWNLTKAQALSFFSRATAILPEELHSSFAVLPCQYTGSMSIRGELHQFSINIGSFGVIRGSAAQSAALFGCKEDCKDLFRIDLSDSS